MASPQVRRCASATPPCASFRGNQTEPTTSFFIVFTGSEYDFPILVRRPTVAHLVKGESSDASLPRILDSTYKGLTRIAQVVDKLRDFARLDRAEVGEFDVNESIDQSLLM
jgi:signal transduction histidine kinase